MNDNNNASLPVITSKHFRQCGEVTELHGRPLPKQCCSILCHHRRDTYNQSEAANAI